jgi:hypothetical protein
MDYLANLREEEGTDKRKNHPNDGSAEMMKYFNKIFKFYPPSHHKNMYVLIFFISISNGGLFKSDLENLFI